jgi:putative transposase
MRVCPLGYNACAENFFSMLKGEFLHRFKPRTIAEGKDMIDEHVHFYNHERVQLKTSKIPMEVRNAVFM